MTEEQPLALSAEEMRSLGYAVIDLLVERFTQNRTQPVTRTGDRPAMEDLLREPPPEHGQDPHAVLDRVRRDVLHNAADLMHPRFFGFVPSPSNFVGVLADALASGYNIFAGSWLVASGPAEVELVTVDWLRQLCGLPESAGGLFVSGGSMATLTALAVAREVKLEGTIDDGVAYCSDQTHSAVARALTVLGFTPNQLRILPSDEDFRLSPTVLAAAIREDRAAGRQPFCVIATPGTTNTGAIDPLDALADLSAAEDLWLHADGAYGAPAVLTERGKEALRGLHRVDSLTLDPHKWLFQPFEIGCLLLRDGALLPAVFAMHPEYLRDVDRSEEEINYRDYGIQLTRGFRALKLWMSLQVFGLEAFRAAILHGIELAETAEHLLRASGKWEIVTRAQLAILTFRPRIPGLSPEQIDGRIAGMVEALTTSGLALVLTTVLRGRVVLRLCTINPRTTEDDLRQSIQRLEELLAGG